MSKVVVVPLAAGFEEIEAVALVDVLRRAELNVIVASVDGGAQVKGAHGIVVGTDRALAGLEADAIDMIVLPGGWGGTNILAENAAVQSLLKAMDAKGKAIGALCAAPYALHTAGVLKHNYTCYPSVEEKIRPEGFLGDSAPVVEDGNVMTSRGPGTAICFGLQIVRKLVGQGAFEQLRKSLLAEHCG